MQFLEFLGPSVPVATFFISWIAQVTVISGVALVASIVLRRQSSAVRHSILLTGLVSVLLVPAVLFVVQRTDTRTIDLRHTASKLGFRDVRYSAAQLIAERPSRPAKPASADSSPSSYESAVGHSQETSGVERATITRTTFGDSARAGFRLAIPLLILIWFVGLMVLAIRFLKGCYAVRRMVRNSDLNSDSRLQELFDDVSKQLSTRIRPRLLRSPESSTPLVVGIIRPTILLPHGMERELDDEQIRSVLLHEMAHIIRRDNAIGMLQFIIGMLWWPHPLVHRLNRRLAQSREEICDNYALSFCPKHKYARTLLQLSIRRPERDLMASTIGLLQPRWPLEERIKGVLDDKRRLAVRFGRTRVAIIVTLMVAGTMLLSGTKLLPATDEDEVLALMKVLGAQISEPDGAGRRTVMIGQDWEGTTDEMTDLKHISGIQSIRVATGAKLDEVVFEDLPDLESIGFITSFFDETIQKQVIWDRLPIKTIRLKNLPKIGTIDQSGGGVFLSQTQVETLELAEMGNLTVLNCEGLQLNNGILQSVAGAPNLTDVQIARPWFSCVPGGRTEVTDDGLKSLPSLKHLVKLSLDGGRITDEGLKTIATIKSLEMLSLCGTDITDKSIETIAALPNLTSLGIAETRVTASGLMALKRLSKLKSIELDTSQLTMESCTALSSLPIEILTIRSSSKEPGYLSAFPKVWMTFLMGTENLTIAPDALKSLKRLHLRGVGANAAQSMFEHFKHLENLVYLEMTHGWDIEGSVDKKTPVHITDDLLQHVADLTSLQAFHVNSPPVLTEVSDRGIAALSSLNRLESVIFTNSQITDQAFVSFAKVVNLKYLSVAGTQITNSALEQVRRMKHLQSVMIGAPNIDPDVVAKLDSDFPNLKIQIYKTEAQ